MNLKIKEFEQKIINILNNEQLPVEVKRLVLKDILDLVTTESNRIIQKELIEKELEEKKLAEKENNIDNTKEAN